MSIDFSKIELPAVTNESLLMAGITTKLYDFQRKAVAKMCDVPRIYNACDLGNGKSIQALATYALTKNHKSKLLIICPASLKYNWKNEIEKHTTFFSIEIVNNNIKKEQLKAEILIINYELLTKYVNELRNYDTIIADEFHYCKNHQAKRTLSFMYIQMNTKRVILLSGTPTAGKAIDLYTATQVLEIPFFKNFTFEMFANTFCYKQERKFKHSKNTVIIYVGIKNEQVLKEKLYPNFLRFEAKEVDLPEQIHTKIKVPCTGKEQKEILELIHKIDLSEFSDDTLEQALDNVHISTLKSKVAEIKVKHTCLFAQELLQNDNQVLVVYSDHILSCRAIYTHLKSKGFCVACIDGSTDARTRHTIVNDFQNKKLRVLVGTSAISTGLTLTAADVIIINDASYNVATNIQTYKRIHRIGQINRCKYYHMTIDIKNAFNIDASIVNIVKNKSLVISKILK